MTRSECDYPRNEAERRALLARAQGNWTRAITATDKAVADGKTGVRSMKAERHWMTEYRRLGGRLPVTDK